MVAPRVIIIGGGIGGLTFARALELRHIPCAVYERAAELGPVGAGIVMQTRAMSALRRLGLDGDVARAGREVLVGTARTPGGKVLQTTDMSTLKASSGATTVAIQRGRLHQVLLGSLSPGQVHTAHALSHFEQDEDGVSAHFENGAVIRGDLLIGADGLHSRVRAGLFGTTALRYAGYTSWRGVVAGIPSWLGEHEVTEFWGRGQRFGVVPIAENQTYWFAVTNAPEGESDLDPKGTAFTRFSKWPQDVTALIAATPPKDVLRTDIHDRVPIAAWSRERVTLIGDAAHPTTPNLGQGGCMAIEDAVVLAHELASRGYAEAFACYEALRLAPTNQIVQASWRFGAVAQWDGRVSTWLRDALLSLTPASVIQKELQKNARFILDEIERPTSA